MQSQPDTQRERVRLMLVLGGVFLVALLLRLWHLSALREAWAGTQLFSLARGDAAHHWREAQAILDDDFWLRDRVFWKGPFYSYLLAGLMEVLGREPAALRWPFAWLGAINCAGLVLLARRALPLGWAALCGLLVAVHGVVLVYDTELFFPPVLISCSLGALGLLARERPSGWASLGAGVLCGIAAATHPVYLLPAGLLTLLRLRSDPRVALALAGGVALAVLPITIHNVAARGEPVLISWSGGVNLYIGNQPGFDQTSGQGTAAWARVLDTPLDAGLRSESEIDRAYLRLTGREALAHPWATLGVLATKLRILVSPAEIANNFRLYELREVSPVLAATLGRVGPLWWPFGVWAPFALLGLWQVRRTTGSARTLHSTVAWWSLGLVLSILLSFNTARYRVPLVFVTTIWTAVALRDLTLGFRTGGLASLRRPVLTLLALGVLVALAAAPQRTLPPPWRFSQAQVSEGQRDPAAALEWLAQARAGNPQDPLLDLEAASMLDRANQPQAADALRQGILARTDLEPDLRSLTLERSAQAYLVRGDFAAAADAAQRALDVGADAADWRGRPYFQMQMVPSTACRLRLLLAEIQLRQGRRDLARSLVARARADCPGSEGTQRKMRELDLRLRGGG